MEKANSSKSAKGSGQLLSTSKKQKVHPLAQPKQSCVTIPDRTMLRQLTNVFGGPAMLPGEGKDEHTAIHNGVFDALQPQDYVELLWAVDIADAEIDVQRMKRLRTKYMQAKRRQDLIKTIAEISPVDPLAKLSRYKVAEEFVNDSFSKLGGESRIYDKLKNAGHDPAMIMANAVYESADGLEVFDRLIDQATKKRDHLIKQFWEYRGSKKGRRRGVDIIDLEAEEVLPG